MRTLLEKNKWLAMLCLGLVFSLSAACSDDEADNGANNFAADAGQDAAQDAGDTGAQGDTDGQGDTNNRGDTGDQGDTDNQGDATTGTCDINGVTLPEDLYISEDTPFDNWGIYRVFGTEYIELSLVRDASIDGVGTLDFAAPSTSNDAYLLLGQNCNDQEKCETYYNAISGTLEVTKFEKTIQGDFKAILKNVRLAELDETGHTAADGKTWCVSSAEITAKAHPLPDFVAPQCTDSGVNTDFSSAKTDVVVSPDGWLAVTEASATSFPRQEMRVELYDDYQAGKTYAVDDVNYATCTACVSIQTGCTADNDCTTRYNAGAGELTIDTLDMTTGEFKATLKNARFVEVTQDGDYSIIVEDGGGWCLDSYTFSGTFTPPTP